MKVSTLSNKKIPTNYKELMDRHPIRPIRDDTGYQNACEVLYQLIKIQRMTKDQSDYFDLLSDQIKKYEDENYPIHIENNDPIENIKSLMDDHNLSANALGRILGSPELGSRILNRKRKLNVTHIQNLSEYFNLVPGYFFPRKDH